MLMVKPIYARLAVFLLFLAVVLTGCAPRSKGLGKGTVPDASFAESAVAGIDSLLGYVFSWEFGRKQMGMIPRMSGALKGRVGVPDRIHIEGAWGAGTATERVDIFSIEGREYTFDRQTESWKRGSSGLFLNPHEHLKLVLSFGEFSFAEHGSCGGEDCYVFSFKPNVYFLDPVETSEPAGKVWISVKRQIPLRVRITAKKNQLSWDMKLSKINSFADLNVPFKDITFNVPSLANEDDRETIVGRFLYLGFEEPAVERNDGGTVFSVKAENLSDTLIESMLKRGTVELFLGVWPSHPIYVLREDTALLHKEYGENARLLFERGVITKPIISTDRILTRDAFQEYELKNDLLGAYSLYAIVSQEARDSLSTVVANKRDEPVVVLVDGYPLLISNIRDAWIVELRIPLAKGLQGKEAVRIYARLRERLLEKDYGFLRVNKEE